MWRWSENRSTSDDTATSLIDQGCEFEGRLVFAGTLVVNGRLRGEVISSGTLIVGEEGELDANIQVGVAIVSGKIEGEVSARERVELRKCASMHGGIVTPVLILEEGVVFDGHCTMNVAELESTEGGL